MLVEGLSLINAIGLWPTLAVAGVVLVIALNLHAWRRDRRLALELAQERRQLKVHAEWPSSAPRVSFLIPAWNEHALLPRCLESILSLSYPDIELVLCAGGEDGTLALARRYECDHSGRRILVLEQGAGEGKLHSLQRCFEASTGELIYLTDADCVIEELAFFLCVNPILTEGEQVVTGSLYLPLPEQVSNEFVQSQMAVRAYSSASHEKYSTGLLGGNAVIRRGALAEVEAFQHGVPTGTDYDLAKRLLRQGVRIRYQLHASIHSEFPTHPRAYLRQQARWIRNVVIYGLPYGAYTEVFACLRTSFVGLAMMLGPVIYLAIALWRGPLSMAAALAGLGWALIFLQALLSRIRYQRFSEIWLQTPANAWKFGRQALYLWLDFAVWSVPLLEYPIQSRRERW